MNIAFLNANCYNCKIILSFKRKWVLIVERCLICRKDVFFKLKIKKFRLYQVNFSFFLKLEHSDFSKFKGFSIQENSLLYLLYKRRTTNGLEPSGKEAVACYLRVIFIVFAQLANVYMEKVITSRGKKMDRSKLMVKSNKFLARLPYGNLSYGRSFLYRHLVITRNVSCPGETLIHFLRKRKPC